MKRTFFNRVLLTYSLIVCISILLFFSCFIFYVQHDTQSRIESYSDESFSSYVMSYDNAFESMQYMAQNIKYLRSLDLFAFSSSNNYYPQMTALFQDLQEFSSQANNLVSTGGYSFMVHKSSDDTVVTNQCTLSLLAQLGELGLSPALYRTITGSLRGGRSDHYIFTDHKIIYLIQKDFIDSRVVIGVYAELDALKLYPLDPNMRTGMQLDPDRITDLRTQSEKEPSLTTDAAGEPLQQATIGGMHYKWMRSNILNIVYYYYLTGPSTAVQTVSLVLKMGAIVVLICLLAFGIIALFSMRLYRPIERLIDTFMSFDVNSNRSKGFQNEIDYLAQNVMQVRSRNQELVAQLERSTNTLKTELVNSILQNTCNHDTLLDELKKFDLHWLDGPTVPVLFELPGNLADALAGHLESRYTAEHVLNYSGRLCFVIRAPEARKLKEDLKEIVTFMDTAFQQGITAYIGQESANVFELRSAFVGANRIVENKYRMPPKSVYDYEDYRCLPTEIVVYPIHNELRLIEAVEQNNEKEMRRLLDYIFDEYAARAFQSKEGRDLIRFALVNTVNRTMQQMGLTMQQIAQPDELVYLELKMCATSTQLRGYTIRLFERILAVVKHSSVQKAENFQLQLKEYIEENLQNDVSLLNLAEHFNLSPNYMSVLFKSTMNDHFKDYLSKIRFERAVEILKADPSIKLSALGEQVGIGNVNTLIRMFKKFSGLSPGMFIKENRSAKSNEKSEQTV